MVIQTCTDNTINMLGAMDDIVTTYLHIFKQGCTTHTLDLMLEDWIKINQFKDLIKKAKHIFNIQNQYVTVVLIWENSPKKSLIVPANIQFAC